MSSPSRRQLPSVRPSYTQRQPRQSITKYESISQRSPMIDSPRLNEQAYEVDNPKNQLNTELKTKLEIVLKHNSQLLNQNATLSQMVNTLRIQVETLRKENQNRSLQVTIQLNRVMDELKQAQSSHQFEISKLLNEIGSLHQQTFNVEQSKNKEIKSIKENHEKQLAFHIQQLKRSTDEGKDILDVQIKKLKEIIELRDFQLQSLKVQTRCEIERLKFQNRGLQNEIDHLRKLKQIEIKEVISEHKEKLKNQIKEVEREKQLQILRREVNLKKLRKQLNQKNLQIQQVRKQGATETQQIYDQLTSAKNQKLMILEELRQVKQSTFQKLNRQKQRLTKIAEIEKENMDSIINTERQLLKQEREKVILLCIEKTHEIKRLYDIINEQRETFESQRNTLQNLIDQFKQKLKQVELQNKEEFQLVKVKMAHLHQADIKTLESYYENEVRNLIKENKIISESHQADRAKIHKALQQNDELRKNFQIQTSKQKAKLQDMKVKFAAAHVEFKEQITSLGTKMQLTSQTLLRQTQQKQKGAEFFQSQKRKFYRIIQQKDKEILAIQETMSKLKQINDDEIQQQRSQINMLRDSLISKQEQFKNLKANLEIEFERKSLKIIEQAKRIEPDEQILKQNDLLRQKCDKFEKDNFKKTKEIQFLHRQVKSLQGQLGLRAGFIQTLQLQSSAAIQDQKSKIKVLMNQSQVAMRDYYETKLSNKEKEIQNLKRQTSEKDYDLRAVICKYNTVQKKLKSLLQAQNKLTQLESKIVNLGLDQNLVKNMAELFKKNRD